ncbi:calcium-activated potassium channel subunit beta-3 [Protopterus annectens]|uniref:calcium-activated potassium channel subunit beta-3 n=1 Tax=Protopterus annectens TaxID=7888 RepID=UPI001CF9A0EE|nr:calcium-activated potassium channel subunit beta-3 [Protopterus annectens]
MFMQPVAHRQSFSVPIRITLQCRRRCQMREAFTAAASKNIKKDASDGGKGNDKNKQSASSNAGEDRAMLLGFFMMGFSVLMYFLLGITILKPFMLSIWSETSNCTLIRADIMDEWVDCYFTCGVNCRGQSKYPCLQVFVNLSQYRQKALLHYNEEAIQINPKCFYIPRCQRDRSELLSTALSIKKSFDHNNSTPFSCYYNPDSKPEDVILVKKYDGWIAFHCLFWPTMMLLGGAAIVGMVKLTQHLSQLCEEYAVVQKEPTQKVTSETKDPDNLSMKHDKIIRWRQNLRTMHHTPLP